MEPREFKICPIDQTECDVTAILCHQCGFDLTFTTPTLAAPEPVVTVSAPAAARVCTNGHPLAENDNVCMECGASLAQPAGEPAPANELICGVYRVPLPLPRPASGIAEIPVRHPETNDPVLLRIFPAGREPDPEFHERLARVNSSHVVTLRETGRAEPSHRWEAWNAPETAPGGDLSQDEIHALALQLSKGIAALHEAGILLRDLRHESLVFPTREPFQAVLTDLSQAAVTDLGVSRLPTRQTPRYLAPEAAVAAFEEASDWWSMGALLLDLMLGEERRPEVNEQAMLLNIVTRGIPVPQTLPPIWQHLLKGLLTRDPAKRWSGKEVTRWLNGERGIPQFYEGDAAKQVTNPLKLGEVPCHSPEQWALTASHSGNWDEAGRQLERGAVGTWLESLEDSEEELRNEIDRLRQDGALTPDERLAAVLVLMNARLPLAYKGELVNPAWLLAQSAQALTWLEGPFTQRLHRIARVEWLTRLRDRRDRAQALIQECGITTNRDVFRAACLVAEDSQLMRRWVLRRADFPAARRRGLAIMAEKPEPMPEELLVLISALPEEFIPAAEILEEATRQAATANAEFFNVEVAREEFQRSHREIYRTLNQRLSGFVHCGRERLDEWADELRFERRLPIARALVLLQVPEGEWVTPPEQDYLRDLFEFFHRRILSGIQQGPLMRLRAAANSRNVDLMELGGPQLPADQILARILGRERHLFALDPAIYQRNPLLDRRLRRLYTVGVDYQRDTGIDAVYLGFPLLVFKPRTSSETSQPRRAPLFLWPLEIQAPVGQMGGIKLGFDAARSGTGDSDRAGAELNPALLTLLPQAEVDALREALDEALTRTHLDPAGLFQLCQTALPSMTAAGAEMCAMPSEAPKMAWGGGHLFSAGAIFLCDFSQQTIAQDLRQIRGRTLNAGALNVALRLEEKPDEAETSPAARELDKFFVLPADPSQQRAVLRARGQRGIVIQGPPGTGKSQTIVNIVADCMGRGERVLVVCQKHAALEVVARRLTEERLGDRFFLIEDARRSTQLVKRALREQTGTQAGWRVQFQESPRAELAGRVERLEKELSAGAAALVEVVAPSGLTYAGIVDRLIELRTAPKFPAFKLREALEKISYEAARAMADQIGGLAPLWYRSHYFDSPWKVLSEGFSPDPGSLEEFRKRFTAFLELEKAREELMAQGSVIFALDDSKATENWLDAHREVLSGSTDTVVCDTAQWRDLFEGGEAGDLAAGLQQLAEDARKLRPLARQHDLGLALAGRSPGELRKLAGAAKNFRDAAKSAAWMRFLPHHLLSRWELKKFAQEHAQTDEGDAVLALLVEQIEWETARRALTGTLRQAESRLAETASTEGWPMPAEIATRALALDARLVAAGKLGRAWTTCPDREQIQKAFSESNAASQTRFLAAAELSVRYAVVANQSLAALVKLEPWFAEDWLDRKDLEIQAGKSGRAEMERMSGAVEQVGDFLKFRLRLRELPESEQKLFAGIDAYRNALDGVPESKLSEWVENTILQEALTSWKALAEKRNAALQMDHAEFAQRVEHLRKASEEMRLANRAQLQRPWMANAIGLATHWAGILALQGTNSLRLRGVIEAGIDMGLFNLRPIWLANPETVSRLFPLRENLFDVVIFDEASQMPVEMALPAMFRAKRAIISGDRKQLPPTSFFHSQLGEEEEEPEDTEAGYHLPDDLDEDSRQRLREKANRREIKDCQDLLHLAENELPEELLTIHYRSRWRHLIQFSNHAFYEGRLSVPVHHPEEQIRAHRPVEVRHINTPYGNQVNEGEALAIVEFLEQHWSQPNPPSIGVVTFNAKQAELIEDRLEQRAENQEAFRILYDRELQRGGLERFFIRNLENVQGDERDWIVFSTTFGPDENGRFVRNFGPLIQHGGERRLNVAITRSRDKMVIFTSMPIPEIAKSPPGAGSNPREILKSYLSFCEAASAGNFETSQAIQHRILGAQALVRDRSLFERAGTERAIVREVRAFLEANGFKPETGTSQDAFKFDLALVDAETGHYSLAIECDPPLHPDLDSARAREIWRVDMMRGTIPATIRIWSRAWLETPEKEQQRLLAAARGE